MITYYGISHVKVIGEGQGENLNFAVISIPSHTADKRDMITYMPLSTICMFLILRDFSARNVCVSCRTCNIMQDKRYAHSSNAV
jgi:hypothetical protein